MRNRTSDLRIPCSDALPLSHRDSTMGKAHYEVHIRHASCILLGSAMSIASYFVYRLGKIVSFKLGKEIEKDVLVAFH